MQYNFSGTDVVQIARDMIGMELFSHTPDGFVSGIITETEAYAGISDRASHAWNGRRTKRTEIMYCEGGTIYIYLCYGIHSLLNIVTNKIDIPEAVLIRAIKPISGMDLISKRLNNKQLKDGILYGPGNVTKAMNIHFSQSGMRLNIPSPDGSAKIRIEQRKPIISNDEIIAGKRIGVDYAGEDALLPYRFTLKKNDNN